MKKSAFAVLVFALAASFEAMAGQVSFERASSATPQTSELIPRPALSSGVACSGGDDTAALNALLGSGAWSLPAAKTCLVASPLNLAGSTKLSGHQWSTVLSPSATVASLVNITSGAGNNRASVEGLFFLNASSFATSGVRYSAAVGASNNPVFVSRSRFQDLTNAILSDSTWPGGDALRVADSFFQNDEIGVNLDNSSMESSIHGNYFLGTRGIRLSKKDPGVHSEGVRAYDNSIFPTSRSPDSYSVLDTAGVEHNYLMNTMGENRNGHGVVLDSTGASGPSDGLSAIKLSLNWIAMGGCVHGSTCAADKHGVYVPSQVIYLPVIGNTIRNWTGRALSFEAGVQDAPIAFNHFQNNDGGDALFNDATGVTLFGNRFRSNPAWTESGTTRTVAIGNRCEGGAPATVSPKSLILGDGSCATNSIPGQLNVWQDTTSTAYQLHLDNQSTAASASKITGAVFGISATSGTIKAAGIIRATPIDGDVTSAVIDIAARKSDTTPTTADLRIDFNGNTNANRALMVGSLTALTLTQGAIGLSKMTASGSAPGAAGAKIELVCSATPGKAKLQISAGTDATPVTIIDNIGAGVTGC